MHYQLSIDLFTTQVANLVVRAQRWCETPFLLLPSHWHSEATYSQVFDIDGYGIIYGIFKVTALAFIWKYCNWESSTYGFLYCLK